MSQRLRDWMMTILLAILVVGTVIGAVAVYHGLSDPLPGADAAPEIDAYAMQAGMLASVVPVALSTVVARDQAAALAATETALVETRMSAVATEVRRDSLNNVDHLSTRVAQLDDKVDLVEARLPTPVIPEGMVPGCYGCGQ